MVYNMHCPSRALPWWNMADDLDVIFLIKLEVVRQECGSHDLKDKVIIRS